RYSLFERLHDHMRASNIMDYVILGAGPAGVTAAETIRGLDRNGKITLIGGEPEPPYSRMAIPYLLHGAIGEHGTYLRQDDAHYNKLNISYVTGKAGGIDTRSKRVYLSAGPSLPYDRLLIATGASPLIPRVPGANLPGVHCCWTLPDAREILKLADKGAPVVLVGAGFIGSIVLEALHQRGCDLTVVEIAPRMVARMMDDVAGGMLGRWCLAKGVNVKTGTKVERIGQLDAPLANGATLDVGLSDGSKVPAKLVVLAAGVRSNVGFLVGSGIAVGHGIRVDDTLQTSVKDVYAAGDCCEGVDISTGKPDMLAIQPVAVEHGRIAGQNMAGKRTPHRGSLNMNVLDTMGLISSSFGLWQGAPGGETVKLVDDANFKYLKLEFLGSKLVGAQCVGLTDHVGMLRGLIQTELDLGVWKTRLMEQPERLREAYVALTQNTSWTGAQAQRVKAPIAA
ncbi:MAG: FAD-dependent oxidoreductase, partial [Hyphomicrobiaceae bacterium]|nr:FAD-dependent oxidoreductase [Hyphomicrobiaceae bacterium]